MLPTTLKLESFNHCFAQLPEEFVTKQQGSIKPGAIVSIKSIDNEVELYTTWNGQLTSDQNVHLDFTFGRANKFQDDELIVLSRVKEPEASKCSFCRVEFIDSSDYNILSQHSEAKVLDTCKLVTRGLVIPIVLSKHVKVLVKVVDIRPNTHIGILSTDTQMQFHQTLDNIPKPTNLPEADIPILKPIPFVHYSLGIDCPPEVVLGPMLICGVRGSGKTHFLKSTIHDYRKYHSQLLNCNQLKEQRPENVAKKLKESLNNALENQPSILCLDDIDSFVPGDIDEGEKGWGVVNKLRMLDAFISLTKQLERSEHVNGIRVCILATCRSFESLNVRLRDPKGRKYFIEILHLGVPSLEVRVEIIKNNIAKHKQLKLGIDDGELEDIAKRCGSFMPGDLKVIVEQTINNACSLSIFSSDLLQIKSEHLLKALEGYTPINLRGVALQSKTSKTFDDVGGMKKIKEALMKTILVQIKYPKLFKKCPMQPQTSILLYGPPGCGKTLIAEALTNQECLNSICVRGPELLSKYTGASEGAVRNLFKNAELARPCVIFFDEFESLVSKRGADSTGVTDRIVNQFLTLMDGVEKLSGDIFIVAASSRPDMIDPAILRPGRLDKHIYCPVPNLEDRADILRVLTRNIELEENLIISDWAEKLEGFTGADVKSLLYSAQLKALHDIVGPTQFSVEGAQKKKVSNFEIVVKQSHLVQSYNEMKADVELRYRKISTQYPSSIRRVNNQSVGTRLTLA